MAASQDLLLAILAMDSYNRGYKAGLQLDPDATTIGTAELGVSSAILGDSVDSDSSFFAQSYILNGQKVISYRGTDDTNALNFNSDIYTGWSVGAFNSYSASQAELAAQFFQPVGRISEA